MLQSAGLRKKPMDCGRTRKDKKWYFAANGQIQTQHTGVAGYDGKLFYVIKGELATDYKGTIKYNGAVYEVINGQLYKKK